MNLFFKGEERERERERDRGEEKNPYEYINETANGKLCISRIWRGSAYIKVTLYWRLNKLEVDLIGF